MKIVKKNYFFLFIFIFYSITFYTLLILLSNIKEYQIEIKELKDKITYLNIKLEKCNSEPLNKNKITKGLDKDLDYSAKNIYLENESDVFSYSAFTQDILFPAELGVYKRNIIKLTGQKKLDIHKAIQKAVDYLNFNNGRSLYLYEFNSFLLGFYRVSPQKGYEYDLYFKNNHTCLKVSMNRPLKQLTIVDSSLAKSNKKITINFIVPLTTRDMDIKLNALKIFMKKFEEVALYQDNYQSTLTIVHANKSTLFDLNLFLNEFKKRTNFSKIKLINVQINSSNFLSRAHLLQIGVDNCCMFDKNHLNQDELIFFTDIDVVFNQNFLDLCRHNAIKKTKVFFPILYSFYNPTKFENANNFFNLAINKDNGFWRDSGFGMVCLYKQDFIDVGGFKNYTNVGWGGEDLFLYRNFLNSSNIEIFRSITPGLFHLYHEKECNRNNLNEIQYRNCVYVKILNEASHKDFGLYYYNLTNSIQ